VNIIQDILMRTRYTLRPGLAAVVIILFLVATAGCVGPKTNEPAASPVPAPEPVPVTPPHHSIPLYSFSLYAMQKNLAGGINLSLPTYLPDGFFFFTGSLVDSFSDSPADNRHYSFTYHRGQDEWVTLSEQSRNSTTCPDGPEYRLAELGKTLMQRPGSSELSWGRDGWCFTLSSMLSREEMEKIAASVEPAPYREGVMPPYEYQPPAHPLVRQYHVNRSIVASETTITFESLQCTPDGCTAIFGLSGASLPPDSLSPVVSPMPTLPPANPDLHAEWRVDGGRPLLTMPGGSITFNTTFVSWKIEPLPEDSRELSVNISRVRGISGPWVIVIPLEPAATRTDPATSGQGVSS
jgi:hypothetical protein